MYSSELYGDLSSIEYKGNMYSVDMLRVRTRITSDFFQQKIASRIPVMCKYDYWNSSKITDFRENYNIICDDGNSFWLGFISNNDMYCGSGGVGNPKHRHNLTIEFNPNKIQRNRFLFDIFSLCYESVLQSGIEWEVVSCDFAFDIETNILNIGGICKGNKRQLTTYDNGGDDKTFYLGKGANRIKIYNKRIESDLQDKDLTRIELTYKFKNNTTIHSLAKTKDLEIKAFPRLYLKEHQMLIEDLDLSPTMKAIMYAVDNGFPLSDLSRVYRDKIKQYESKKEPIKISSSAFTSVLNYTLMCYFKSLLK